MGGDYYDFVPLASAIFDAVARHRSTPEPDDDCTLIVLRAT